MIYRGYDIETQTKDGRTEYVVSKAGQRQCVQLSEDAAMDWIDRDRKAQLAKG